MVWRTLVSVYVGFSVGPHQYSAFSSSTMEKLRKWWIVCVVCTCLFVDQFEAFVACEFTYGYDTDEYTLAFINITYKDPRTHEIHTEKEEVGKFSVGTPRPASGVVVHVTSNNFTSHDACEPLDTEFLPQEPWIALIEYGNCRESTKLRNAVMANATAAVIYNNKPGGRLIKMHHRVFQIVSVFISREKGLNIASLVYNKVRVIMHITVGTNNPFRYANINRTSVLFVSISFIILMIISLAWLVFYYVQRFRYIHAKDILAKRLCSAAKKALDKIPTRIIKHGDKEVEGDFECCAVCIEPFKAGEVIRILPCKHVFHKSCVDPWLLDQRSCPMCKMDILKYYGLVFTGSQESVLNIDDLEFPYAHHGDAEVEIIHVPPHNMAASSRRHSAANSEEGGASLTPDIAIIDAALLDGDFVNLSHPSSSTSSQTVAQSWMEISKGTKQFHSYPAGTEQSGNTSIEPLVEPELGSSTDDSTGVL